MQFPVIRDGRECREEYHFWCNINSRGFCNMNSCLEIMTGQVENLPIVVNTGRINEDGIYNTREREIGVPIVVKHEIF